jgi:hypothetical protein
MIGGVIACSISDAWGKSGYHCSYCGVDFEDRDKLPCEQEQISKNQNVCRWPGCIQEVDSEQWCCLPHWFMIPEKLRESLVKFKSDESTEEYKLVFQDFLEWVRYTESL